MKRVVAALDAGRRAPPAARPDGQRQDRGLPACVRGGARAGPGRDRARAGDRADAADRRPLPGALRRPGRGPALGADRRRARDERERIAAGEAPVVVGARSAVFAPVPRLGLLVVDEEHDASYKQESDPRYDARTGRGQAGGASRARWPSMAARRRGRRAGTPLERLSLGARIGAPMPRVRVVDLRREAGYPLSAPLLARARRRRGRRQGDPAAQPARRGAGAALQGVRRLAALRLVRRGADAARRRPAALSSLRLLGAVPESCPAAVGRAGADRRGHAAARDGARRGTFPELERIRLDADSTAKPGALRGALGRFAQAERAVLVGTQMVAKGHHFAGVALAAVVDADTGLALPDFRADERAFQLVTQLAGRSGRDAPGLVLVQTFQPDALPIAYAARHDVAGFLAGELERRRELGYPPYRHLVSVLASAPMRPRPSGCCARFATGSAARRRAARPGAAAAPARPHRSQLLAKVDRPRRSPPARPAARRGRSGDAQGGRDGGRRRRPAVALRL